MAAVGITITEEQFYAFSGMPTVTIIRTLAKEQHVACDVEAAAHEKERLFLENLESLEPIHSVMEIVHREKGRRKMAVASGGLILTKKTTRAVTSRTAQIESVAYLFPRNRATPWLLKERAAQYGGLGEHLRPSSFENFSTTLRLIREKASTALYDERLTSSRPIRGVADGVQATDLYAHLLANYLLR